MGKDTKDMTQAELLKELMPIWGEGVGHGEAHLWNKEGDQDWKSLCGETSPVVRMGVSMSSKGGLCMECVDLNPHEE